MPPDIQKLPTEFDSERLFLRRYQLDDAAQYFQMLVANRDHLYEFLPPNVLAVENVKDAENVLHGLIAGWQSRNLFIFGNWEKATGAYVGETYLANPDWQVPCIELGYFLVKVSTGKGLATEAARATIGYAFEHLEVSRVELQCRADNLASMRVAERCGFQVEGRQRQRHRKKDGTLVDRLWYGLLRSEWQRSKF